MFGDRCSFIFGPLVYMRCSKCSIIHLYMRRGTLLSICGAVSVNIWRLVRMVYAMIMRLCAQLRARRRTSNGAHKRASKYLPNIYVACNAIDDTKHTWLGMQKSKPHHICLGHAKASHRIDVDFCTYIGWMQIPLDTQADHNR